MKTTRVQREYLHKILTDGMGGTSVKQIPWKASMRDKLTKFLYRKEDKTCSLHGVSLQTHRLFLILNSLVVFIVKYA